MRNYPRNSPQAAARIVALVLLSDGHVSRAEIETLQRLRVEPELGLAPGGFAQVMHVLCEDLLMGSYGRASLMCSVDEAALASLMAEVDDPVLQHKVLCLAGAAAEADLHLADAEAMLLGLARKQWRCDEPVLPAHALPRALQPC